jgi:uncharacterized UPF0160 family protein
LKRTRKSEEIERADIVFDVGGIFDRNTLRFDHHQSSYQGDFSSAGMVLSWLKDEQHLSDSLYALLKQSIVDYVDDVDNGRTLPSPSTPCFAQFVDLLGSGCNTLEEFDAAFDKAAIFAQQYLASTKENLRIQEENQSVVHEEMEHAVLKGRNYLLFDRYVPWKKPYFQSGGAQHQTEFVIFPSLQKRWQAVSIPPEQHSFAQKKSFPIEWAGLRGDELSEIIGIPNAIFCHKNRFIAVFDTLENTMKALRKWDLITEDTD